MRRLVHAVTWPCLECRQSISRHRAYIIVLVIGMTEWGIRRRGNGAYCIACARTAAAEATRRDFPARRRAAEEVVDVRSA